MTQAASRPIDLFYWPTPNCWKVTILCEEAAIPYRVVPTNILEGAQFTEAYARVNPFRKVPAIIDYAGPEGRPIAIAESAAILLYLAGRTPWRRDLSAEKDWEVIQWLLFQVGTVGPMLGQAHHFRSYSPQPIPYAIERYTNEAAKIYGVLDQRLGESEYLAGEYSLADMCVFPWTVFYKRQGQKKEDYPHFARWFEAMKARPAVQRGIDVGKDLRSTGLTEEQRKVVFGKQAAGSDRADG
jgi:GST-like protein